MLWQILTLKRWGEAALVLTSSDGQKMASDTKCVSCSHGFSDYAGLGCGDSQVYPLFYALWYEAPNTLVLQLLKACPEAASCPNEHGYYPLHCALMQSSSNDDDSKSKHNNSASFQVIQGLVDAHRDALSKAPNAKARAREGQLPLHIAIFCGVGEDIVLYLLNMFKEGASFKDFVGNLPIHIALERESSHKVILALIVCSPHGLMFPDSSGCLPKQKFWQALSGLNALTMSDRLIVSLALEKDPLFWSQYTVQVIHGSPLEEAVASAVKDLFHAIAGQAKATTMNSSAAAKSGDLLVAHVDEIDNLLSQLRSEIQHLRDNKINVLAEKVDNLQPERLNDMDSKVTKLNCKVDLLKKDYALRDSRTRDHDSFVNQRIDAMEFALKLRYDSLEQGTLGAVRELAATVRNSEMRYVARVDEHERL